MRPRERTHLLDVFGVDFDLPPDELSQPGVVRDARQEVLVGIEGLLLDIQRLSRRRLQPYGPAPEGQADPQHGDVAKRAGVRGDRGGVLQRLLDRVLEDAFRAASWSPTRRRGPPAQLVSATARRSGRMQVMPHAVVPTPEDPGGRAVAPVSHRVCPWWLGPILASPLRRLIESPERLLGPLVRPGMTVVEPGCGMGFFTLTIARLVGPTGRVVCVDVQPQMIDGLRRRARRAGLLDRIQASVCAVDDPGLGAFVGTADLAVAIHVLHEVPDASRLLAALHAALRPGGSLLVVEPKGHVSDDDFARTLAAAAAVGFVAGGRTPGRRRLSAVLEKPAGGTGR